MKSQQFLILLVVLCSILNSCASKTPRTKWTDKSARVYLSPENISTEHYVQIQEALVQSGKFIVVDRGRAFEQVKREQERTHRHDSDRFGDREKYSHWGKLFGVGAIVVAHVDCVQSNGWWNSNAVRLRCRQHLAMIDTNTGEVIVAVDGENDGPTNIHQQFMVPDWKETVAKLEDSYPTHFENENYQEPLRTYREVTREESLRQKERVLEDKNPNRFLYSTEPKAKPAVQDVVEGVGRQVIDKVLPKISAPAAPVISIPSVSKPDVSVPRVPASSEAPMQAPSKKEMVKDELQDGQLERKETEPGETQNSNIE